jgi:hypothetical protein
MLLSQPRNCVLPSRWAVKRRPLMEINGACRIMGTRLFYTVDIICLKTQNGMQMDYIAENIE